PQHQAIPAGRPLVWNQRLAHPGMDTVSTDQDVTTRRVDVSAGAIKEIGGDAAFILGEGTEATTGVNGLRPEPLFDRAVDDALQATAMNRELRHVVTRIDAARFAPDFLTVTIEIVELVGADRDVVELRQETERGKLAHGMRQCVDADAKLANGIGLFKN